MPRPNKGPRRIIAVRAPLAQASFYGDQAEKLGLERNDYTVLVMALAHRLAVPHYICDRVDLASLRQRDEQYQLGLAIDSANLTRRDRVDSPREPDTGVSLGDRAHITMRTPIDQYQVYKRHADELGLDVGPYAVAVLAVAHRLAVPDYIVDRADSAGWARLQHRFALALSPDDESTRLVGA